MIRSALFLLALLTLSACGSSTPRYTLDRIKTVDPDREPIGLVDEIDENTFYDAINYQALYQIEKVLDLGWGLREIGDAMGLVGPKQAENVNVLGEVPLSSWYEPDQAHYLKPRTREQLALGPRPAEASGPDLSSPLTVVAGKSEGKTAGFTVEDVRGDRYIMKFDGERFPELTSSAEVISTLIFHASGYHVPQNSVVYFDPDQLRLDPEASVRVAGVKRRMTEDDLTGIVGNLPRRADGRIRALASKYVTGRPVGIWEFEGTRDDDPNDRVRHEHRRELRGLSVLSSWLNDTDRRNANTFASFIPYKGLPEKDGKPQGYIRHYLLDMGSTLGANGGSIKTPRHGNEYITDPRSMATSFVTLGLWEKEWETVPAGFVFYPSVGYYEGDIFEPERWVMVYPNPAFERRTDRDGFWGATRVMSFSPAEVRHIVDQAQMTNPEAKEYLIETMLKRREKIGRFWFDQINPLDRFVAQQRLGAEGGTMLSFDDLSVTYGLEPAAERQYDYRIYAEGKRLTQGTADKPLVPIPSTSARPVKVILHTRQGDARSLATVVYLDGLRVVGVHREED